MELPAALRQAVDQALTNIPLSDLAAAVQNLSARYRGEIRDGALHLADDLAARAYLATRLPATYAAISATLDVVANLRPDFSPRTLLDIGAGPGTALWAAGEIWPIADAVMIERSGAIRAFGEKFSAAAPVEKIMWRDADVAGGLPQDDKRDLVVIAYVLNELAPEAGHRLIDDSWAATGDMLVVIEPGTPAGWRRILQVRERLLAAGAHLIAPCPHTARCPIVRDQAEWKPVSRPDRAPNQNTGARSDAKPVPTFADRAPPDWCHFSRRVARSRVHRMAKSADVPWEDEKFIYLACSRQQGRAVAGRVIAPPRTASGRVTLKLCRQDGTAGDRLWTRREGAAFKRARGLDWGDELPADAQQP